MVYVKCYLNLYSFIQLLLSDENLFSPKISQPKGYDRITMVFSYAKTVVLNLKTQYVHKQWFLRLMLALKTCC